MAEKKINIRAEKTYSTLLIVLAVTAYILPFLIGHMQFNVWDWGVVLLFAAAFFLRKNRIAGVVMRCINTLLVAGTVVLFALVVVEYCREPETKNMFLQWVFGRLVLPTVAFAAVYGTRYDAWLMHITGFLFTAETALYLLFQVKTDSWLYFVVYGGVAIVLWAASVFANPITFPQLKKKADKQKKK